MWAVLLLCPRLENTGFTTRTDHDALKWILILIGSFGRLARWRYRLSEYEFDVFQQAGIKDQATDALFCLQTTVEGHTPLEDDLSILAIDVTEIEEDIRIIDTNCGEVLPLSDKLPLKDSATPSEEETIFGEADDIYCRVSATQVGHSNSKINFKKLGIFIRNSRLDEAKQIFVPLSFRQLILYLFHYHPMAGHPAQR